MASFFRMLLSSFIISLIISPSLSSPTKLLLNSQSSTFPTTTTSPASPCQELSPDIAPLLPSPGGVLPSPTPSSLPTIPSTPSPPNPDELIASGPDSAFSPLASLPASSAAAPPRSLPNLAIALGRTVCWLMQLLGFAVLLFTCKLFTYFTVYAV